MRYQIGVPYWLKMVLRIAGARENKGPGILAAQLIIEGLRAKGYSHLFPTQNDDDAANADEAQAA